MIVPWLRGFLKSDLVPLTWTLIFLNCCFFLMTHNAVGENSHDSFFTDPHKFELTSRLYFQYLGNSELPTKEQTLSFGMRALRDAKFINEADKFEFKGDQVAIQAWKKGLIEFRENLERHPSLIFGLSWNRKQPLTWITYQFMHAGWMHLLGNMLMLLIFAGALEIQIGGLGVVSIYLFSGIAGALGFLILGEPTLAPMVGASGALSGLMSFYVVYERKKRVPFFYFLSPIEGFYGKLWLPVWMIFPLFFVADIAAYFGTVAEFGSGVAYTAHIGGMVFGLVIGFIAKKWIRPRPTDYSQVLS